MKMTAFTKAALADRRFVRLAVLDGFEEVTESGGRLWEIHRGFRFGQVMQDARIAPSGLRIFVKVGPKRTGNES